MKRYSISFGKYFGSTFVFEFLLCFPLGLAAQNSLVPEHVSRSPLYVGKSSYPNSDSILFEFLDVPTEERLGRDQGNIAGFGLKLNKKLSPSLGWSAKIPAYTATKNATGLKQDTNVGNVSGSIQYSILQKTDENDFLGYGIAGDFYLPTARERESGAVASSSPTITFFDYSPFTTTLHPRAGVFIGSQYWSLKTDLGYAYQYISKDSYAVRGKSRHNFTWQSAATWYPAPFLDLNLEYNAIVLDHKNADPNAIYRHSLIPSISGKIGPIAGNIYIAVPLDQPSRNISTLAVGLKLGFIF